MFFHTLFAHVLQTPYIYHALTIIFIMAMFVSPILYNGDHKSSIKALWILFWYVVILSYLQYNHLFVMQGNKNWLEAIILNFLVFMAYFLGIAWGIVIFKYVHRKRS